MEDFSPYLPQMYMEGRPEVFTRKSFLPVDRFARRFRRLLVPTTPDEEKIYEGKYGEPPAIITPQELEEIPSLSDLRALVDERTGIVVRRELGEVLRGARTTGQKQPTKGAKSLWKGDDAQNILNAAADKRFDEIDDRRTTLLTTALGTSLVAERARTRNMESALRALPVSVVERFGMSARQREVIVLLMQLITKVNAEYLRFHSHLRHGESLGRRPKGALRERRFIFEQFSGFIQTLEDSRSEGGEPIFGSEQKDRAFAKYLGTLQEAYRPFAADRAKPLTLQEQEERMEQVQQAFLDLHTRFPDFPLIVFPAFSHYSGDEAAEAAGRTWKDFSFDPEIRLYWQARQQREKQPLYHRFRDRFADNIDCLYPRLVDTESVRRYRVIIGDPIAASGINIRETTESQEEQNIVLMTEGKPDASDREAQRIFETYLQSDEDLSIIRHPAFRELGNKRRALHEFGHGLFPERSRAADALGGHDDQLAELKSDLAMWVTACKVLEKDAQQHFGEKALRAIQLSMISDAIDAYGDADNDPAYVLSARCILEGLARQNVFVPRLGKLVIDTSRLDQDLGGVFENDLREMLEIYSLANQGKRSIAKRRADRIMNTRPKRLLSEFRKRSSEA